MRALVGLGVGALLLGSASLAAGVAAGWRLGALSATPVTAAAPATSAAPTAPAATPMPGTPPSETPSTGTPAPARSFATLQAEVDSLLGTAGASGGVSLVELAGADPRSWSDSGDQ